MDNYFLPVIPIDILSSMYSDILSDIFDATPSGIRADMCLFAF